MYGSLNLTVSNLGPVIDNLDTATSALPVLTCSTTSAKLSASLRNCTGTPITAPMRRAISSSSPRISSPSPEKNGGLSFLVIETIKTFFFLIAAMSGGSGTVEVGSCAYTTDENKTKRVANSFFIVFYLCY